MKLVLLGTTGYHPNNRRHTACMMLPELGIVLDAGTGFYRVSDYLQTDELNIFLTHAHLDHCLGLTFLFDVLLKQPATPVNVYGEAEKIAAIEKNLLSEYLFPVKLPCEFKTLPTEMTLAGDCRITNFPLAHPGGAVGYRLDWPDRSMAYVTDTTATTSAAYLEKIQGVDLLIHECYFGDDRQSFAELTGHSCITPVLEVAKKAQVGRMVLVHMNPADDCEDPVGLKEALSIFPETILGEDLLEIEF